MFRALRARRCALLPTLLVAAVVFPASAQALTPTHGPLTRTIFGHGTLHVGSGASPFADFTSPPSTPPSVSVTSSDGDTAGSESCDYTPLPDGSSNVCSVSVTAVAPTGWTFSSWGGDCAGTVGATCTQVTFDQECVTGGHPPCTNSGSPMDAIAHFTDTRAPTTSFTSAPANNSVVYSDTQSQQFTFHTDEDAENPTFACRQEAGAVFFACSSGFTWSSLSDGLHDFCVHATDASSLQGGNTCVHWEQERNPTASITSPAADGAINPASFSLSSNKASHPNDGSTLGYACTISGYNGGAEFDCANPLITPSLSDGAHTLTVKARFHGSLDGAGVTHDSSAVTRTFTIDTTAPTVSFSSGPSNNSVTVDSSGHATFGFTASDATTGPPSVQCKLDGASFGACTSATSHALTGVPDGVHDFTVKATDGASHSTTATVHWEQETPANAALDSGPAAGAQVSSTTAHFTFHSTKTDRPVTFQCALDSNAFGACSGATSDDLSNLSDGAHTLQVRAVFTASIDGSQHAGPAVSRTWTVDTTPPDTTITGGPTAGLLTNATTATFTFTGSEPGAFKCSLDGAAPAACASPDALSVGPGAHTFSVLAVDQAGNADPSPATRSWTVTADADGDGFVVPADCNDHNAAIHPGAVDIPGNAVDENCDGHDAPFPPIGSTVAAAWKFFKSYTKLTSLAAVGVPAGATITLTCKGKKGSCKFKRKTIKVNAASSKVALTKYFKGAKLKKGTTIDVQIAKPGMIGADVRYRTNNGKLPTKTVGTLPAR
jgi:hypothetical protein